MVKRIFPFFLLIVMFLGVNAQVNQLVLDSNKGKESVSFKAVKTNSFEFNMHFDKLNWKTKKVKTGDAYTEIWLEKCNAAGEMGTPKMPAFEKLIKLPLGATASVKVDNYTVSNYNFSDLGITNPIVPVQPSLRKDQDSLSVPFQIKKEIYAKQAYLQKPIATIEVLGNMRNYTIARLVITPVDYNPALGKLKVYNDIDVEVNVENTAKGTNSSNLNSPYFDILSKTMYSTTTAYDEHPDLTKYPVKMLIISNRMFESSLQPFIAWKIQKGFNVVVAYTDAIGTTNSAIKSYIQQQYNSGTESDPAPTFLVFVGDVGQVAASATGTATGMQTDLYYASVDGDIFPDMYYGRLSATTTDQLDNIIEKIIYYEKYQFADPSYLNDVTLIAGADATYNPIIGQPTIKYGTANYFNTTQGFVNVNEFGVSSDPNNSSALSGYTNCYTSSKISVGFINYTAHGSETTWYDPALSESMVNAFTNQNKYPLAVANCCLSGNFGSTSYPECIGETWIRAKQKGAVTYIGSSPSSYWQEDMYWAVGAFPMVGTNGGYVPTFEETTTGAYDAPFVSDYYTAGAMVFAGNLAVTEVDANDYPMAVTPTYYWEAYNVLGDPSLIPYFKEASANQVTHESTVPVGVNSIKVSALKGSYISITKDSEILGVSFFEATGEKDIPITQMSNPCSLTITVTRPQTIPYIGTINEVVVNGAYLILDSSTIDDSLFNNNGKAEYSENTKFDLVVKNIGIVKASNTSIKLTDHAGNATLLSSDSIFIGDILSDTENNTLSINNAFEFGISPDVSDKTTEEYTLTFQSDEGTWTSILELPICAPVLDIGEISIVDSITGNNDGVLNAGESAYGLFVLSNTGHSDIKDLAVLLSIPDSLKDLVILKYELLSGLPISESEKDTVRFRISIYPEIDGSFNIPVIINTSSASYSGLNLEETRYVSVSASDIVKMQNQSVTTCEAIFTDSGGDGLDYSNDENYTTTITSASDYGRLKVSFSEFSVESGYDYLYVYDGSGTSANQIAGSPFTGSSDIGDIYSSGNSLTFKFVSDGSMSESGWVASVSCIEPTQLPVCVANPTPSNNQTDVCSGKLEWDAATDAQLYDVYIGTDPNNLSLIGRTSQPTISTQLEGNTLYYWKVLPGNYLGVCTETCDVWSFTTAYTTKELLITNGTVTVDSTWFYDSGGANSNYQSDEDYTITLSPKYSGNKVKVEFAEFNVESCTNTTCDYLSIYNGPSTQSTLVGTYTGTTLPTTVTSTSTNGELTVLFHSDYSDTRAGWKAKVTTVGTASFNSVTISVKSNDTPVTNATVTLNGLLKVTDTNGNVKFSLPVENFTYSVVAQGYEQLDGNGNNTGTDQTINVDLEKLYDSNISIVDNLTGSPISGASVSVGHSLYYSGPSGVALIDSPLGNVDISIESKGYETVLSTINVTGNGETFEYRLNPAMYSATILVQDINGNSLPNAQIDYNGSSAVSQTDGSVTISLPYGISKLSTSKSGYLTTEQWLNVEADMQVKVVLDIIHSDVYDVNFTVKSDGPKGITLLDDAKVSIYANSVIYIQLDTDDNGRANTSLPDGLYSYIIERDGYDKSNQLEFSIDGNSVSITDTLVQKTYILTFNVQSHSTPIENATISISGYTDQVTDASGFATFNTVGYEKGLSFTIQKDGFNEYSGTTDVDSDKIVSIEMIPVGVNTESVNIPKLYPNPASDEIYIEASKSIYAIQIVDITGKVVLLKNVSGESTCNINLENLTRGIYVVLVKYSDGAIAQSKLIKM